MADEQVPALPNDAAASFQRLLEKNNNDGVKLATQLFDENFQHRTTIRELQTKIPKDGMVVVGADDAKQLEAFKQFLGETKLELKDIKKNLERLPDLERANKELAQMDNLREVAALGGYKPSVLKKLMAEHPEAIFEFKTEADENDKTKERKVAYIKNGDKEVLPFTKFAEDNFSDFLPALKADAEPSTVGQRMFKQAPSTPATPTLETEKEAIRASGAYGAL